MRKRVAICSLYFALKTINGNVTTQKKKFYIKSFFSKCDQICRKMRICSHLLKKSLTENFNFCAMFVDSYMDIPFTVYKYDVI